MSSFPYGYVSDSGVRKSIKLLVGAMLNDKQVDLDVDYIARRGWCAAPVSGSEMHYVQAECLAEALRATGWRRCYVVSMWTQESEGQAPKELVFHVPVAPQPLLKACDECWPAHYQVTTPDLACLLWCEDDFKIIAGSKSFVETAIGGATIDEARREFMRVYSDYRDDIDYQCYKKISDMLARLQEE